MRLITGPILAHYLFQRSEFIDLIERKDCLNKLIPIGKMCVQNSEMKKSGSVFELEERFKKENQYELYSF